MGSEHTVGRSRWVQRLLKKVLKSKKVIFKVPNKTVCDKESPKASKMFMKELEPEPQEIFTAPQHWSEQAELKFKQIPLFREIVNWSVFVLSSLELWTPVKFWK
jgi:hypothetical protein